MKINYEIKGFKKGDVVICKKAPFQDRSWKSISGRKIVIDRVEMKEWNDGKKALALYFAENQNCGFHQQYFKLIS